MEQIIRDYIIKEFMFDNPGATVEDDQLLIQDGIIDSLGIFTLIAFVEKEFGVKIQPEDVVVENFESINKIVSLVNSKLAERASAK